jgi:hypothetical protein
MEEIAGGPWIARRVEWTEAAEKSLLAAFEGDWFSLASVSRAVKSGKCWLYMLDRQGEQVGFFAMTIEDGECEIVAAGGKNGLTMTRDFLPIIEAVAKEHGAAAMKICTFRPGMMRLLDSLGYKAVAVEFHEFFKRI